MINHLLVDEQELDVDTVLPDLLLLSNLETFLSKSFSFSFVSDISEEESSMLILRMVESIRVNGIMIERLMPETNVNKE